MPAARSLSNYPRIQVEWWCIHTRTFYKLYTPIHHFFSHFIVAASFLGLPPSQMVHLFFILNKAWAPETIVIK